MTGKLIDSYNVTRDKKIEMHELVAQNKEEDALAEKMKKEEKSLEEKLTRKKKQEDSTEYLPTTKQRSAAREDEKITEMREEQGKIGKDAMRTPASLGKIRKSVRPTATRSSPCPKHVKEASIRKLFELGVADRDALHTTSPLTDRSVFKSKFNPFKCADQWCVATQTGPRQDAESSKRQGCY